MDEYELLLLEQITMIPGNEPVRTMNHDFISRTASPVSRRGFMTAGSAVVAGAVFGRWGSAKEIEGGEVWRTGNKFIDEPREIALSLLKPTAAQLERAWELHFNSLVFESYGFAPRAALDGKSYQKAYEQGATPEMLREFREEMEMTRYATDAREKKEFFDAFAAAGVTGVFQNCGEESSHAQRLIKRLSNFTYATDLLKGELDKVVNAEQIENVRKNGGRFLCFTTNGVPLAGHQSSVQEELMPAREFHHLGVRMMHVTYNRRNPLGDGVGEPVDAGLSDFGKHAIAELNRLGIIADVSHSGWKTSLDTAKVSTRPVVASHTTCAAVHEHFRSKPDEVIKAICDTDGLVGLCCIPRFLGGEGDLLQWMKHLHHLTMTFGTKYTAIGTDVVHMSRFRADEVKHVGKRPDGTSVLSTKGKQWEHLWPDDPFTPAKHAIKSMAWTNWPMFTVAMVMMGLKDEQIQEILGGNVLRVLRSQTG